jgi:hypothetical protein
MAIAARDAEGKLRQCRTILSLLIGRLQKVKSSEDDAYTAFLEFRRKSKQALEKLGEILFALEGKDVDAAFALLGQFNGQLRFLVNQSSALGFLGADAKSMSDYLAVAQDLASQATKLLASEYGRKAA